MSLARLVFPTPIGPSIAIYISNSFMLSYQ
jgi:hypothetical protein